MTPERWKKIESIYHAVSTLPGEERSAHLDLLCAGDQELREEVESLLAQEEDEGILADVVSAAAGSLAPPQTRQYAGQMVGPYSILNEIGSGGMGTVYLAEDTRLGRRIAVKILPSHFAGDEERLRRFKTEARTASAINHPNIITVHEIGEIEGTPYIVTEFVEGKTLEALMNAGPMTLSQIVDLSSQVADALDEAHNRGIVHRDIKPTNIMLTHRGQVKVLDFGLAKFVMSDGNDRRTRSGVLMGTVQYMSPEQVLSKDVDHRTDLFSLGIVMYEMTSGQLPFRGENTLEILEGILHQGPEPVSRLRSGIPPELERIISKCLEKEKERRYASARDLAFDLKILKRDSDPGQSYVPSDAKKPPPKPASGPVQKATQQPLIAVLYFENLNRATEEEYLRDGITEDIITELSKIKDLRVFPRSAMLLYRDKGPTAQQVGMQLNTTFVLDGTMRRVGDRVRITTQLIETDSGHSVWAERFDRTLMDVLDLQEEIARSIAQALRITLTPQEDRAIASKPTANPQAYDLYLRGRNYTRRATRADLDFAIQMFEKALEIEPGFALAHAGIANVCGLFYDWYEQNDRWIRKGLEASERALALAPELAEGLAGRARIYWGERKYEDAIRFAKMAILRKFDCEGAYWILGLALFALERCEEAASLIDRALEASGDDYNVYVPFINILGFLGREQANRDLRLRQIRVLEQQLKWVPEDVRARMLLSTNYAYFGNRDEAVRELQKAVALRPEDANLLYNAACTYGVLQMKKEALAHVKMALHAGFHNRDWVGRDPDLACLRDHPEFQKLLKG